MLDFQAIFGLIICTKDTLNQSEKVKIFLGNAILVVENTATLLREKANLKID